MLNITPARRVYRDTARCSRRGATTIEFALVLIGFLILLLGTMDLAIGIYRCSVLTQTARTAAREAIVHGELSSVLGPWEPENLEPIPVGQLAHPIKDTITHSLIGINANEVSAQIEWLEQSNSQGSRVRVQLEHAYRPISGFVFGQIEIPLVGSSTMTIAH